MRTHGLAATYRRGGCRCESCKAANTAAGSEETIRRILRLKRGEVDVPHGRRSTYSNWGCRCELCTEANVAHRAAGKARLRAGSINPRT